MPKAASLGSELCAAMTRFAILSFASTEKIQNGESRALCASQPPCQVPSVFLIGRNVAFGDAGDGAESASVRMDFESGHRARVPAYHRLLLGNQRYIVSHASGLVRCRGGGSRGRRPSGSPFRNPVLRVSALLQPWKSPSVNKNRVELIARALPSDWLEDGCNRGTNPTRLGSKNI